jgi:hypothetical protein
MGIRGEMYFRYVDTDMTSHKGHWPVSRGVLPILFAATLPPGTYSTVNVET